MLDNDQMKAITNNVMDVYRPFKIIYFKNHGEELRMKLLRSIFGRVFLASALLLVVIGCSSTSGEEKKTSNDSAEANGDVIVMKYTHGLNPSSDDPHHWAAETFKELVEEYSEGKVEVEIYPAGQLGSEARGFQDVQNGVVQATSLAVNNALGYSPSMGIFDLPYIFEEQEEFYHVIDTYWDDFNEKMIEESGNRAIIWFDQGFRVVTNSKQPIEKMEDIKGLKIRVPQNPIMIDTFKQWGAAPTPISWDETFNALQQGVADGQENPYTVNYSSKFQEVQKYITDLHYKMWIGPVVVNDAWLKELPEDVQEAIIKAGKETSVESRKFIEEKEAEILQTLLDEGMESSGPPTDEEVWKEKALELWPEYYDDIGGTDLLEKVMSELGRDMP